MPEIELLATGEGEYRLHDPDTPRPRRARDCPAGAGAWRAAILRAMFGFDYTPHGLTRLGTRSPPPTARGLELLRATSTSGEASSGGPAKN